MFMESISKNSKIIYISLYLSKKKKNRKIVDKRLNEEVIYEILKV